MFAKFWKSSKTETESPTETLTDIVNEAKDIIDDIFQDDIKKEKYEDLNLTELC